MGFYPKGATQIQLHPQRVKKSAEKLVKYLILRYFPWKWAAEGKTAWYASDSSVGHAVLEHSQAAGVVQPETHNREAESRGSQPCSSSPVLL